MSKINLPKTRKEIYLSRRKFNNDSEVIEKKCSKCKTFLSVKHYFKNKRELDGLYNYCKECHREKTKMQYKIDKNKKNGITQSDLHSFFSGSMD